MKTKQTNKMIASTENKGFSLTFNNEITISVQFGTNNYCSRRSFHRGFKSEMKEDIIKSNTAEIAIWDKDNNWFDFGSDKVLGHIDANEVAIWIGKVSTASSFKDLKD